MCEFISTHPHNFPFSSGPPQIQFFAHLTTANIISAQSMISLLLSFTAVLDEFGVSQGRAKRAALCVVEGLLMVCSYQLIMPRLTRALLVWSSIETTFRSERA